MGRTDVSPLAAFSYYRCDWSSGRGGCRFGVRLGTITPLCFTNKHVCITQSNTASSSASSSSCPSGLREPGRGRRDASNPPNMSSQGSGESDQPSAPNTTAAALPRWWGKRHFIICLQSNSSSYRQYLNISS